MCSGGFVKYKTKFIFFKTFFFCVIFISLTNNTTEACGSERLQTKLSITPSTSNSPVRNLALHNNCCYSFIAYMEDKIELDEDKVDSSHPIHH